MNKTAKRSIIVSAVLAIIMCISLAAGATFALFTSDSKVNITVSSGKVNVVATVDNLITYSGQDLTGVVKDDAEKIKPVTKYEYENGNFINGGSAEFSAKDDNTLSIQKMTPGDKVTFDIKVQNNSNVAIQYRTIIMCEEDNGLFSGLTITLTDGDTTAADGAVTEEAEAKVYDGRTAISKWASLDAEAKFNPDTVHVAIDLPSDRGNEYQEKSCKLSYKAEAVQGNAAVTAPDENTLEIYTASDLKWFRDKINNGTIKTANKTFLLTEDIDLAGENWMPIGTNSIMFQGTFDGNGKTISNLKSTKYCKINNEGAAYGTGLFGYVKNGTVKNLVIENADVGGEYTDDGRCIYSEVGIVAGCSYGTSTFDKITVINSTVKAQTKVSAIVGNTPQNSTSKVTNCKLQGVTVKGNYSYALVAGLIHQSSTIDMTGTTVDTTSKTEFWTSENCDFKGDGTYTLHEEGQLVWELYHSDSTSNNWYYIIKCNNAWAVKRGTGKKPNETNSLWECIIYTGASSTDKVEYLAQ